MSVLEKGLRPLVLAINVSKFLPASSCSKRIVGIRSWDIFRIVASVLFFWFLVVFVIFFIFFQLCNHLIAYTYTMYEHAILFWSLGTSRLHSIITLREKELNKEISEIIWNWWEILRSRSLLRTVGGQIIFSKVPFKANTTNQPTSPRLFSSYITFFLFN